jgi:protocatechuate 3,4-dioxygenase beta subunit
MPSQVGQPRDPGGRQPEPVGTGIIRGRVVTGDSGNPVRRANVNLIPGPPTPSPPPIGTAAGTGVSVTTTMTVMNGVPVQISGVNVGRPKSATTDAQGMFEFTGLPAGTYRILASAGQYSAAYLGIAYGATRPSGPGSDMGTPIPLADGQTFTKAVIALPRGAVITGRVTDEMGEALARVQVYTLYFPPGSPRGQRMGSGGQTDDLGQFRLYGLTPGEYSVVAEARGNTFVQPNAPPETEEDKIGFMTTYYPGTADEGAAQRVRARAGTETPGVEIRMVSGRLFRIGGTVMDSKGMPGSRTNGTLFRIGPGSGGSNTFGFSTDEQGRFQMRNIPPGDYRLMVRQQRPGPGGPDGLPPDPGEMGTVAMNLAADVDNLMVVLTPGATITGQVVFELGPPAQTPQGMRISASFGNPDDMRGMNMPTAALVSPDLTFTMKGLLGAFVLRTGTANQFLKAVMLGGEDITDTPREFKNGERVTVIMTSRASILEGNVTDLKSQPATDAGVILFSEDKASWRSNSTRTRRAVTDQAGHYRMMGLMPGRYFIAAMPRERTNVAPLGPEFFEQLSKEATSLVIGEDEQRQVDLKLLTGGGVPY